MLVRNGTPEQIEYLDRCVKGTIAELSNLDIDNISKLLNVSKQFYADILSEISVFTKVSYFAMDNFTNIETSVLSSMFDNERRSMGKESFSNNIMTQISDIIGDFTTNLTEAQNQIISSYGLGQDSLSLFSYNEVDQGINFKKEELTSPLLLKYYEGKQTLKITSDLIKIFTDAKNDCDISSKSISMLSGDKASDILNYFIKVINGLRSNLITVEYIIDVATLTRYTYNAFLLSNDKYYHSFLSRNYDKIKQDIVSAYFK